MKRLLPMLLLATVVLTPGATAQFELQRSVSASGGACVADASFRHCCTIGQSIVGRSSDTSHILYSGFWHPIEQEDVAVQEAQLPIDFALTHASTNPGGPAGSMSFAVPAASHVTIRLFDVTGREIQTLVNDTVQPGYHRITLPPRGLAPGIYFCRMMSGDFSATRKLVLLR
jgi:hypothetical protein